MSPQGVSSKSNLEAEHKSSNGRASQEVWHRRLGHLNARSMNVMQKVHVQIRIYPNEKHMHVLYQNFDMKLHHAPSVLAQLKLQWNQNQSIDPNLIPMLIYYLWK
ncbi:hypothetical protein O3G_MSEX008524 [Manduca sexta]|uniref:GAG-pre-integrase domain-containing protein n=1 Tax=Manduca sexta TaxID=7130 RepID=A0A921ZAX6_MANSE|nr:hypothetical protein O3G_MSEX008524 [Manduca sexta]